MKKELKTDCILILIFQANEKNAFFRWSGRNSFTLLASIFKTRLLWSFNMCRIRQACLMKQFTVIIKQGNSLFPCSIYLTLNIYLPALHEIRTCAIKVHCPVVSLILLTMQSSLYFGVIGLESVQNSSISINVDKVDVNSQYI